MQSTSVKSVVNRRERWGWYLYDFGNSAYAAVVLLAVYSIYFQGEVVGGAEGSRLWGISLGIAMLVVFLTMPILGAIADFSGAKKRILAFYTAITCIFTAALFFVQKGDIVAGMVLFILAEIGYRSGQVFYNGLLPEIAAPHEIGRVSGNGWAIGSVGGILCLLIVLPIIVLVGGTFTVRLSLAITGVFFAVSAAPLFLLVRERAPRRALPPGENYVTLGFGRLARTVRKMRHYREFAKFLLAFIVFNIGIIIALDYAGIIGSVLYGFNQTQLILMMILVQVTSVAGAFLMGLVTDRSGSKNALFLSIAAMAVAALGIYLTNSSASFYVLAAIAGFALTGVQSVSRTMVGQLSPAGKSGEFYGLFAAANQVSAFIGPVLFGGLVFRLSQHYQSLGEMETFADQLGHRTAVLVIVVFLIAGATMLWRVNEQAGRRAAAVAFTD
jgi:UMF1 family MFS transporter